MAQKKTLGTEECGPTTSRLKNFPLVYELDNLHFPACFSDCGKGRKVSVSFEFKQTQVHIIQGVTLENVLGHPEL